MTSQLRAIAFASLYAGSIDGEADTYLDDARSVLGHPSHSSTEEAVANLISGLSPFRRYALLVGHGRAGHFITGRGQPSGDPLREVALYNEVIWRPQFERLKGRVKSLRLVGCWVGAGEVGAQLLEAVSCAIDAPAYGPTGVIKFRRSSAGRPAGALVERQNRWQKGVCGADSIPMDHAPSYDYLTAPPLFPSLPFSPADVVALNVERLDVAGRYPVGEFVASEASLLFKELANQPGFDLGESGLGAIHTAVISIVGTESVLAEFDVYGDRVFRVGSRYYPAEIVMSRVDPARTPEI